MARQPTESDTENGPEAMSQSAPLAARSSIGLEPDAIIGRPGSDLRRKLAAILAADVAGYSKLMAEDEEETLRRLEVYRGIFDQCVTRYDGRIFNTAGDAVLAEFASAVEAVRCAIDVQENLKTRNLSYVPERRMEFRIGITVGDVVERGRDLLGDGVNVAARLQAMAKPGGVCVSRWVYEQVGNKVGGRFQDLGLRAAKNIPQPVHVYAILLHGEVPEAERPEPVAKASGQVQAKPPAGRSHAQPIALGLAGIAIAAGFVVVGRTQSRPSADTSVVARRASDGAGGEAGKQVTPSPAAAAQPSATTAASPRASSSETGRQSGPAKDQVVTASAAKAVETTRPLPASPDKPVVAKSADEASRKPGGDIKQIFAMVEGKSKGSTTAPVESLQVLTPPSTARKAEPAPPPAKSTAPPAGAASPPASGVAPAQGAAPDWLRRMTGSGPPPETGRSSPQARPSEPPAVAAQPSVKSVPVTSEPSAPARSGPTAVASPAVASPPAKSAPQTRPKPEPAALLPSASPPSAKDTKQAGTETAKDTSKDLHDVLAKVAHAKPGTALPSIIPGERPSAQPANASPAQPPAAAAAKSAQPSASVSETTSAAARPSTGWWAWLLAWGTGGARPKTEGAPATGKPTATEWPATAGLPTLTYPMGAPAVPPPAEAAPLPVAPVALPAQSVPPPTPAQSPSRPSEPQATTPPPVPVVTVRPSPPAKAPERTPENPPEARERIIPATPLAPPPAAVAAPQQARPAPATPPATPAATPPAATKAARPGDREPGPVNLFPELRETAKQAPPTAAERRRGARSSICSEIIERAQVGGITDEDRLILQRDCRR